HRARGLHEPRRHLGPSRPGAVRGRPQAVHQSRPRRGAGPPDMSGAAAFSISSGLAEAIGRHAAARPEAPAFRFMARDGAVRRTIAWRELHRQGSRIAGGLYAAGLVGRRVAIVCPDAADFVLALAGCLLAGAVAVPLPAVATRRSAERIAAILATAAPAALVGPAATLAEP